LPAHRPSCTWPSIQVSRPFPVQDKDLAYWKVNLKEIADRAAHHGMQLIRTPAVDFSPHSLRDTLPRGEAPAHACSAWSSIALLGLQQACSCTRYASPIDSASCSWVAAVREQERSRAMGKKVYVHCTAGLGRSPAVAIASLYWFTDMQLDEAYAYLTGIRPCGPNMVGH
jgi:hypothetical protein